MAPNSTMPSTPNKMIIPDNTRAKTTQPVCPSSSAIGATFFKDTGTDDGTHNNNNGHPEAK